MPGIDTSFMTDQQLTWYRKLVKRDPQTWTPDQRTFMKKMAREALRHENALYERYEREYQEMLNSQYPDGSHPGLGTAEGRKMEFDPN